jgi:hypothetical protein
MLKRNKKHKPGFKVRDLRKKEKFFLDDEYVNGWSRYLKPHALAVYVSLCRHANKEQSCFPNQITIARQHGMSERTVKDKIKLLKEWNIIRVRRTRTKTGEWLNNTYFLLDKSEWKKPRELDAPGSSKGKKQQSQGQDLPIKGTHRKDTHKKISKAKSLILTKKKGYSSISSLGEEEFQQIAEKYSVPIAFVRSKFDDLVNYCDAKGREYKNYYAALCNFVKNGALQIRKEVADAGKKRGIDARNI